MLEGNTIFFGKQWLKCLDRGIDMIKIRPVIIFMIFVFCIINLTVLAGQTREEDALRSFLNLKKSVNTKSTVVDTIDVMQRDNTNRTAQKTFYQKWEKYLKSVTHKTNVNYSAAILSSRIKCIKAETELEKVIIKFKGISKDNKFSSAWAKNLRSKYTDKELKRRRREIYDIVIYLYNKCEYSHRKKTSQDLLYNQRMYFSLIEKYHDVFLDFYSTVSEKEKKENIAFYDDVKKSFKFIKRQIWSYETAIVNKDLILFETVVKNLKNKDIYNRLSSEKYFQKPFDLMTAVDNLFPEG